LAAVDENKNYVFYNTTNWNIIVNFIGTNNCFIAVWSPFNMLYCYDQPAYRTTINPFFHHKGNLPTVSLSFTEDVPIIGMLYYPFNYLSELPEYDNYFIVIKFPLS
jgi:hypothetical protein